MKHIFLYIFSMLAIGWQSKADKASPIKVNIEGLTIDYRTSVSGCNRSLVVLRISIKNQLNELIEIPLSNGTPFFLCELDKMHGGIFSETDSKDLHWVSDYGNEQIKIFPNCTETVTLLLDTEIYYREHRQLTYPDLLEGLQNIVFKDIEVYTINRRVPILFNRILEIPKSDPMVLLDGKIIN